MCAVLSFLSCDAINEGGREAMILGKINDAKKYKFDHPALESAMRDMMQNLHGAAPEESSFKKNAAVFTTTSKIEKRYEAHRNYIDIHIVVEGKEYVEVSHVDNLVNTTAYDSESDIWFGDVTANAKFCGYLEPGYFLICFPEDTHLVGAHKDKSQEVKKIVYKIAV